MIEFSCPNCDHRIRVREEHAGKRGTCKRCGQQFTIPSAVGYEAAAARATGVAAEWYLAIDGEQHGPYTIDQIAGHIDRQTLVWREGMPEWKQVERVPELRHLAPPAVPALLADDPQDFVAAKSPVHVISAEQMGFQCPFCKARVPPIVKSKTSTGGWILFGVLLLFCFPLCFLGFLAKEDYRVCSQCGITLG